MKRYITHAFILCSLSITTLTSCEKGSDGNGAPGFGSRGTYVVNEGAFGNSNASISFLHSSSNELSNDHFLGANSFPLGDVAQSMYIHDDRGYIVVNNSQKVEVIQRSNCTSVATITGFSGPRYFIAKGPKGYVSDWFDNDIKIIDLGSNSVTGTIPAGTGPEQMALFDAFLFVTNVGGWGSDSTLTVIDTDSDSVITTITVGLNPNSLAMANDGMLYVLCGGSVGPDFTGGTADDIAGSLWQIDPVQLIVINQHTLQQSDHPSKLTYDQINDRMYMLLGVDGYNGKINRFTPGSLPVNMTSIDNRSFYGLAVDPSGNVIYGGMAPGFTQRGYVFRFDQSGSLIDSLKAGVAPNGFAFSR
jgi:YVTN family beta-propeller protein